ncbi:MAG TPA: primosomal protein N', partial [Dehalococcoidales bacterium]|nr:primosomal protein N' [Dehalococcoidales bacterium]
MPYAEVSVNSPIGRGRTFSYSVPDAFNLAIGQAVWVPFGAKTLQGIVIELTDKPSVEKVKEITGLIDSQPILSPLQVELACWISRFYLTPLFEAVALMLPPGFKRRIITFLRPTGISPTGGPELQPYLEFLAERPKTDLKLVEKQFGKIKSRKAVAQLLYEKLVERVYELEKERIKPKLVDYVRLNMPLPEAERKLSEVSQRYPKQAALMDYLIQHPQPIRSTELKDKSGCSLASLKSLIEKGWVKTEQVRFRRDPLAGRLVNPDHPLTLTSAQEAVFQPIRRSLSSTPLQPSPVFLLFGVTGSGKTEVYLQALGETVKAGKKGLVLVPEISLTPQMIERFLARFPGRVAVLHSGLTLGQQFDEWWRIRKGEFDVVIGPRSALFAPQPDLGLIILDEEHEWTYKQEDSPRYHARETAVKLGELTQAVLVLGSATPDIESYYRAQSGRFKLLKLPERVTPQQGSVLPEVEVVDLKAELKARNLSLFSRSLHKAISEALDKQEQIILFLNRRGGASFIECRHCGLVIRCRRCDNTMSYHFSSEILLCHRCNNRTPVPQSCPRCGSKQIKYLGAGTEKLEQETARLFPLARILRWDSDVLREGGKSHQSIYQKFQAGEADILIGTQIIAKGLDFPRVTLVGVASADVSLNLPDFRAGERTFQLLCQVAGRAGRGAAGGKVIIQTYSPDHYAIQAAAGH